MISVHVKLIYLPSPPIHGREPIQFGQPVCSAAKRTSGAQVMLYVHHFVKPVEHGLVIAAASGFLLKILVGKLIELEITLLM